RAHQGDGLDNRLDPGSRNPAPVRRFLFRSALVGIGPRLLQRPVICIELHKTRGGKNKKYIKEELLELAAAHQLTRSIRTVLFHRSFPVDIRHNSKIFREKLAVWAQKILKR
ncbi:MAG: hypothetical protein P8X90_34810, partial [Desulfobacterales bacterium]